MIDTTDGTILDVGHRRRVLRHAQPLQVTRITVIRDETGYLHHYRPDATEIGYPEAAP
ncbi:MAG: hypothetical protein ABIR68_16955 [Ilumatobacteraceae bacterium]